MVPPPHGYRNGDVYPRMNRLTYDDLAGTSTRGLDPVIHLMGDAGAVAMDDYIFRNISIQSGLYVGYNRDGRTLWRQTDHEEHPNLIRLPMDPESQQRFEEQATMYAARWLRMHNHLEISEITWRLGMMGALRLHDVPRNEIDITSGLFIGQNWDGVIIYRRTAENENPSILRTSRRQ